MYNGKSIDRRVAIMYNGKSIDRRVAIMYNRFCVHFVHQFFPKLAVKMAIVSSYFYCCYFDAYPCLVRTCYIHVLFNSQSHI